jgi:ATP-dependent Clp protease ATP-binding subunit ClpA
MFERFTDRARRAIVYAQESAKKNGQNYVSTMHLLDGVMRSPDASTPIVYFERIGASSSIKVAVDKALAALEDIDTSEMQHLPFTKDAKWTIAMALREALQIGHNYIAPEHLVLAMIREDAKDQEVRDLLFDQGVRHGDLVQYLVHLGPTPREEKPPAVQQSEERAEQAAMPGELKRWSVEIGVEVHAANAGDALKQVTVGFNPDRIIHSRVDPW